MLDVYPNLGLSDDNDNNNNNNKDAIVYLDGIDARIYRALSKRLGSEERVQNAFILMGLLAKLEENGDREGSEEQSRSVRENFENFVGISYTEFDELIGSLEKAL